eukprot:TRINITY_DN24455_c0_g3_i1.p1 TRINITY_DN24455_c0_g3~~TRINITY_DN24455_c0_g3_i1.p1  ORF type:complete len:141 (+),score=13.05 TRINITY_DN24455_c0_g3_i1:57-425(+)
MAECFTGFAKVVGVGAKQRRRLANRGDACADSGFTMCGDGAAEVAESLGSCSTHAPTPAASFHRKRDRLRRWIFGHRTPASVSSLASTAPGTRKRARIRTILTPINKPDVLEQDVLLEDGSM